MAARSDCSAGLSFSWPHHLYNMVVVVQHGCTTASRYTVCEIETRLHRTVMEEGAHMVVGGEREWPGHQRLAGLPVSICESCLCKERAFICIDYRSSWSSTVLTLTFCCIIGASLSEPHLSEYYCEGWCLSASVGSNVLPYMYLFLWLLKRRLPLLNSSNLNWILVMDSVKWFNYTTDMSA